MMTETKMDRATDGVLVFYLGGNYGVFVRLETQGDQALMTFDDFKSKRSESFASPKDALRAKLSLLANRGRVPAEDQDRLCWKALDVTLKIWALGLFLVIELDDPNGESATLFLPLDHSLNCLQ